MAKTTPVSAKSPGRSPIARPKITGSDGAQTPVIGATTLMRPSASARYNSTKPQA
ncbi:MAG: hypothetical protein RL685_3247 [Pseudomonadota bacterium]